MEFRVLGPVEARHGDHVLVSGGGKPVALLALLLLHAKARGGRGAPPFGGYSGSPFPSHVPKASVRGALQVRGPQERPRFQGLSLMRPGGFEPPTNGLEGRRSVH